MDIDTFVNQSIGCWRSQRTAHHLTFRHSEEVHSTIDIEVVDLTHPDVATLCQAYDIALADIASPFRMTWEGESDWDEDEDEQQTLSGTTILVPVPDKTNPRQGKLLRDQGYAETVAAAGDYHFTDDNTFVLTTSYDRAAAEEKIWFVNPNLRFRVSMIKTSSGTGVLTASFASETRSDPS
ncbi:MAG: phycobiliprotein lyase [Symploca sp. SIO2B6]|nr:phycobiliprotein lyase [Symploca sp. SIO2B6]